MKNKNEVKEEKTEANEEKTEAKYFCGKMFCNECKSFFKVRYDVYLKRIVKGIKAGMNEEDVIRNYKCRNCRNHTSLKEELFMKVINNEL